MIKMSLGMEVGLDPSNIVLDGDPAPFLKRGSEPPIFGPCLLWPNGCMDQDATWCGGGPWPRSHCAKWRPSSSSPKRGHSPQLAAHVCCGQTAGWIKMPLGRMVDLGPGNIMLDADPPPRGTASPNFGPCLSWPNGWMDQDATWYEGRLGPGHIVLHVDPASPCQKKHSRRIFSPCLLWPDGRPSQLLLSTCMTEL